MPFSKTHAQAIADGDAALVDRLASGLLIPLSNNFVERPWGGMRMRDYKGLCPLPAQPAIGGAGLGEAFEIAAYDADDEARSHPSLLRFEDGSTLELPDLLRQHGAVLLGSAFVERFGEGFPLLPKTLDIKQLLSVQGHPEGNTEAYIVIDADPGATLRLGFNTDVDASRLSAELTTGLARQRRLLEIAGPHGDAAMLQERLQPWLARRDQALSALSAELRSLFDSGSAWAEAAALLEQLKSVYWHMLDLMNEVPVTAGQIIYNANPARIVAGTGRAPSAEVHALGNPEQREILVLEIRRPGPTFRAWDNVRFPLRHVDIDAAISALNLRRTEPAEFEIEATPLPGRAGVTRSVSCASFEIEHLRPTLSASVHVPQETPHCLHAVSGSVSVHADSGRSLGTLTRGESAIVPVKVGAYHLAADRGDAEVVKVSLPAAAH